jgi:hypothetical protein
MIRGMAGCTRGSTVNLVQVTTVVLANSGNVVVSHLVPKAPEETLPAQRPGTPDKGSQQPKDSKIARWC